MDLILKYRDIEINSENISEIELELLNILKRIMSSQEYNEF